MKKPKPKKPGHKKHKPQQQAPTSVKRKSPYQPSIPQRALVALGRCFRQAALGGLAYSMIPYATDPIADPILNTCQVQAHSNDNLQNTGRPKTRFAFNTDLEAQLSTTTAEKPYVMLGDTDHSDMELRHFLHSPLLVDKLAAAGIRHIFLEIPPDYQPDIDALSAGQITPKEFAKANGAMTMWASGDAANEAALRSANFIAYAAQRGLQVHAVDAQKNIGTVTSLVFSGYIESYVGTYQKMCNQPLESAGRRYDMYHAISRAPLWLAAQFAMPSILNARMDDTDAVNSIRRLSKGEPSVIIYGAAHYAEDSAGLYAHLKDQTAAVVYVFSNPERAAHDNILEDVPNRTAVRIVPLDLIASYQSTKKADGNTIFIPAI